MGSIARAGAGWPALAALGLALLFACMDGNGDPETLRGTLRETCGPTDGPAIELRADLQVGLTCDDQAMPAHWTVLNYPMDSLAVGKVLKDTVQSCQNNVCAPTVIYRLEVESVDSGSVRGTLEVTEIEGGKKVAVPYKVDLKRCPRIIQMCG